MKKILVVLATILVMVSVWYLGSPLLFDTVVDEGLPSGGYTLDEAVKIHKAEKNEEVFSTLLEKEGANMPREVEAMSETMLEESGEVAEGQTQEPELEPDMSDTVVDEEMVKEEAEPQLLFRGQFRDADGFHKGSGIALMYKLPDGSDLLRFEDFSVTNGPALSVYLVKDPGGDPDSGFVDLGKLKGNKGNQNYPIPAGTNLDEYKSVSVWCVPFGVRFSSATFN